MLSVVQHLYALPTQPSVKWLAPQERNLNRDLTYPDPAAETPEEYVSRTYLQFLWLPQVRRRIYPKRFRKTFWFFAFRASSAAHGQNCGPYNGLPFRDETFLARGPTRSGLQH